MAGEGQAIAIQASPATMGQRVEATSILAAGRQ